MKKQGSHQDMLSSDRLKGVRAWALWVQGCLRGLQVSRLRRVKARPWLEREGVMYPLMDLGPECRVVILSTLCPKKFRVVGDGIEVERKRSGELV